MILFVGLSGLMAQYVGSLIFRFSDRFTVCAVWLWTHHTPIFVAIMNVDVPVGTTYSHFIADAIKSGRRKLSLILSSRWVTVRIG